MRSHRLLIFMAVKVQPKVVKDLVRSRADKLTRQGAHLDRDFHVAELTSITGCEGQPARTKAVGRSGDGCHTWDFAEVASEADC